MVQFAEQNNVGTANYIFTLLNYLLFFFFYTFCKLCITVL